MGLSCRTLPTKESLEGNPEWKGIPSLLPPVTLNFRAQGLVHGEGILAQGCGGGKEKPGLEEARKRES